jgi:competence ComEA-like helix-hairpin-helix protein
MAAPEVPAASLPPAALGLRPAGRAAASRTAADGGKRLAINHADADEIRQKLRIDARRARLIIEFRQTYGPFRYPDDVREVNGITDQMVQVWEEQDLLALD